MLKNDDDATPNPDASVKSGGASAENVGQDQSQTVEGENKSTDIENATNASTDGVSVVVEPGQEQPPPTEGDALTNAEAQPVVSGDKPVEEAQPEEEESESEVESDMESSDYDAIEDEIDPALWKKVKNFDDCDFKPEKKDPPKGEDGEEAPVAAVKAPRKKAESDEEDNESVVSSGGYKIEIKSEKERDNEFREYVRELCRPHIISYLQNRIAAKGTAIKMTCTVEGNNIQTRWTKNGVNLDKGKYVQYKSDGLVHTLELLKLTDRDAGEYACIFKNRAGEVETVASVKVFDGKLHKPDHIDIALVKGEFIFYNSEFEQFDYCSLSKLLLPRISAIVIFSSNYKPFNTCI